MGIGMPRRLSLMLGGVLAASALVVAVGLPAAGGATEAHAMSSKNVKVSNVTTSSFKVKMYHGKVAKAYQSSKYSFGYQLKVYGGSTGQPKKSYTVKPRKKPGFTSKVVTGLASSTAYKVKVREYRCYKSKKSYGSWSDYKYVGTKNKAASNSSWTYGAGFSDASTPLLKVSYKSAKVRFVNYKGQNVKVLDVRYNMKNMGTRAITLNTYDSGRSTSFDRRSIFYAEQNVERNQYPLASIESCYLLGYTRNYQPRLQPGKSTEIAIGYILNDHSPVTLYGTTSGANQDTLYHVAFKRSVKVA